MGNHFHLLLETPEPNLVRGMKWWLGVFSQGWNRRSDESLSELRRGWYLGEESFGEKLAGALKGSLPKKRASVSGAQVRAHDEEEAKRLVGLLLDKLGLPSGRVALAGRGKFQREKALICGVVRSRTSVSNGWLAERLSMGHVSSVTRALRRVKETNALGKEVKQLVLEI